MYALSNLRHQKLMSSSSSESSSSASAICCDLFTRNPVLADRRRVAGQARAAVVGAAARPELKSRNHVAKLTGASAAWAVVLCRSISSVHAAHGSKRHRGLQRRRPWQLPLRHLRRFLFNILRLVITSSSKIKFENIIVRIVYCFLGESVGPQ